MRTMAQKRAEYALGKVLKASEGKTANEKKDFQSFTASAPSMILQNGFGQSIAFWAAKGKSKHLVLFDMIVKWLSLKEKDINNSFATKTEKSEFMRELSQMDQSKYLSAQNEALALLEWVKRFANADLS